MAAYEKFAGAQITGGAEATSMAYKPRGGGIPIGEIPNVPRVDLSMPLAKYPGIPAIRYEEMHVGGQDWGRRAAQLQQDELPGSFSRASQRIAAAAGEGQKSFAKSIGRGMEALSQGISDFASGFAQFGERLQNETRDSANAKEDNSFDIHWSNFKAQAAKEGIPPSQWGERFWNGPEGKAYQQEVGGLKGSGGPLGSVGLSDHLESKVAGREAYVHANAMNNEAEQAHKSNVEAHDFRYKSALSENRFDDARQAAGEAKNAGIITDGEYESRINGKTGEIKKAEDKRFMGEITKVRPDIPRAESDKVLKGGKSEVFPWINDDKAAATQMYEQSTREWTRRQQEDTYQLTEQQLGDNPLSEADLRKEAETKGLDKQTTEALVKSATELRKYDPTAAAEGMSAVSDVDLRGDPETALSNYKKVHQQIVSTTDKETQKTLLAELNQKWRDRDKPTTLQADELKQVDKTITELRNSGNLRSAEGKVLPTGKKGTKITDEEKWKANDKRATELHLKARQFQKDNSDATPGELRKFILDEATPDVKKAAREAAATKPEIRSAEAEEIRKLPGVPGAGIPKEEPVVSAPLSKDEWAKRAEEAKKSAPAVVKPRAAEPAAVITPPAVQPTSQSGLNLTTPPPTLKGIAAPNLPAGAPTLEGETVAPRGTMVTPSGQAPATPVTATPSPAPGKTYSIATSAYAPGMGGTEGGNEVASRSGPAYTMERYQAGEVPWVSVAMDSNSSLQGQFLKNDAYPGVVFKVEDTGSAFEGKGDTRIDIAFSDKNKAKSFAAAGNNFQVIGAGEAGQLAGGPRGTAPSVTARPTETTGPIKVTNRARELDLPAMKRPRDTSRISKIVVHGDVLTDVDKLIDVQRNDDRGYHYYIDLNGNITEAVDPGHIAYHIKGANSDSIGIILVGADNGRMPTAAQDAAAKKLISQLAKQYHISKENVMGHGERQPDRRDVREGGNVAKDVRERGFV